MNKSVKLNGLIPWVLSLIHCVLCGECRKLREVETDNMLPACERGGERRDRRRYNLGAPRRAAETINNNENTNMQRRQKR